MGVLCENFEKLVFFFILTSPLFKRKNKNTPKVFTFQISIHSKTNVLTRKKYQFICEAFVDFINSGGRSWKLDAIEKIIINISKY